MEKSKTVKTELLAAANMMERLPKEVIIRILCRLPIPYLMQSKLVCRSWRSLIQDPLFASDHFSNMADNDPSFILQRHPPDKHQLIFYTDLSHDRQGNLITKKPPIAIMEMSLVDSCNGMLCMSDARAQAIYICNPFTRQSMELPKIFNFPAKLERLEFFFHSTTKEYKLLHTRPLRKGDARAPTNVDRSTLVYTEVHVLTIGSPAWRNLGTIPHRFIWHSSKVILNGRLHWLSRPYRMSPTRFLISFDLETEQFQEVPKPCEMDEYPHHLMIRQGCVSIVTCENRQLGIWVMKEYGVKESWIKEFNIGTYLPRTFQQLRPRRERRDYPRLPCPNPWVRVIYSLKSGEILLEYGRRSLVLYDPQQGTFKELTFPEMPNWFKIFVHGKLIKETEQPTSNMMDRLPEDIILGILSKLPVISLIQSTLVCRAWQNLIQDPLLATKHFSNMVNKGAPTFIFQSNRPESSYQLFFVDFSPHSQGKVILKKLPYSSMSWYLVDSCNGLLCMRDFRGIYICNPFTRRYLELPKLTNNPMEAGHIGFSFHQAANEYKVLQIVFRRSLIIRRRNVATYDLVESEVHVLTIGNPAWRNLGTIPYDFTRPMLKAMVNGKLHCLTKPNRQLTASLLVSFDLETEQFQEVPKPDCCGLDKCLHQLMVLRGCLSAGAYHENEQLEIWVMKQYGVKESWIKEYTIGTYWPRTMLQMDLFHYNNSRARFPNHMFEF
ncbi:hypothetical protein COLO4_25854 [Corchorus olitorius]|uniref:F-box domain-containing protein n=1 Tax=Corchorus olitorius TaxID=93759 RepID=A0A1R3HZP9_9ROSI|nr:hypothetical protein COLO4_25854 [Corchorus olitorius]